MSSRRVLKVAEAIREVVSMAIVTELRDPRISDVTVTYVEVSGDLRSAKVHVSVMGGEAKQKLSLHGLQNAAGFLQQKVARRIETRYTPRLTFLLDHGVKHSIEVSRLLGELLPAERKPDDETAAVDEAFDADQTVDDEFPADEAAFDDDEVILDQRRDDGASDAGAALDNTAPKQTNSDGPRQSEGGPPLQTDELDE